MDSDVLRRHLQELHEELENVERTDPRSQAALAALLPDLKRLLDTPPATGPAATDAPASAGPSAADPPGHLPADPPAAPTEEPLPARLEKIAVQFEADHPTLAASSRRLVDLLAKAGV